MLDAIVPSYRGRSQGHSERQSPARGKMSSLSQTTPIQIPLKPHRRAVPIPLSTHTISPEMIFEMSPVTSDFPHRSSLSFDDDHPPRTDSFVYDIPTFSSSKTHQQSKTRHSPSSSEHHSLDFEPSPDDIHTISRLRHPHSQRGHLALDEQDLSPESPRRRPRTMKITGFLPIKGERCDTDLQQDQNRPLERLSPGPRRGSYNSSPWILPGKGQGSDDGLGSSLADASPFEFERSLLRRIENQNRPRFAGLRTYCM